MFYENHYISDYEMENGALSLIYHWEDLQRDLFVADVLYNSAYCMFKSENKRSRK
ncbi:hypothetical protein SAMN05421804_1192 [Proteiniclasticum ruminis]|uniref:Uncharacterized protein n=1 Tax=Proteiniclasticum ruminis TaxID=398199 RepID=A0A1G8TEQ8_9CLOT|nr:hypothetical protein SAMN05421804_1192 [Proteiniclasticum ruminis]